jgi:hypothetical protein
MRYVSCPKSLIRAPNDNWLQRHLFSTDKEATIPCTDIVDECLVWLRESFDDQQVLPHWLSLFVLSALPHVSRARKNT